MIFISVGVLNIFKIYCIKCDVLIENKYVVFGVYENKNIMLRNICVIILNE